jgi:hypothetical protein
MCWLRQADGHGSIGLQGSTRAEGVRPALGGEQYIRPGVDPVTRRHGERPKIYVLRRLNSSAELNFPKSYPSLVMLCSQCVACLHREKTPRCIRCALSTQGCAQSQGVCIRPALGGEGVYSIRTPHLCQLVQRNNQWCTELSIAPALAGGAGLF